MPLNKSNGNMYDWISHTHAHMGGKCSHECSYCYIQDMVKHYPVMREKYSGDLHLIEKEFLVNYGEGKTIFIENCNDLFACHVPLSFIGAVLSHCKKYPNNTYVFQTKNPGRYKTWQNAMPEDSMLGCTIETNRDIPNVSSAPPPWQRMVCMKELKARKFVTIEPVLDFDVAVLAEWMKDIEPEFVNLGADSKNHGLDEPTIAKVLELTDALASLGVDLREKRNLARLK